MIKAIAFDLDDTLYDCLHENDKAVDDTVKYVANELLHMDEAVVRKAFEEGRDTVKSQLSEWDMAAQHNRVLYFQKMLEILGVSPFKYDLQIYNYFWDNFLNRISLFPGALKFIDEARALGIKIGICTDMTAHIQFRKIERLGLTDRLDAMVTSEEAGVEKPNRRMFDMVAEKLGVKNEEVIYIGDSYKKDVTGAKNAGMIPIWYLSLQHKSGEPIPGVYNYKDLRKVVRVFIRDITLEY